MAKTESKVGVGIVGCGFVAHMKHLPALKEIPEAEIVSVFDFNAGRAQEVAENFGAVGCKVCTDFEEVIRDPNVDTVYILTSNVTHSEYAVRALDAGKHVLCEKPMAMSIEEATKMMDAVERSGKKPTIGYQCRLIPEVQYLKRVCDAGELGHIYHARALAVRRRHIPAWGSFLNKAAQGGGCLIDMGTHAIDMALYLMNHYDVDSVMGNTYQYLGKKPTPANATGLWDADKFEVEDSAFALIRMKNGATISVDCSWALNTLEVYENKVVLCGTEAGADLLDGVRLNGEHNGVLTVTKPDLQGRSACDLPMFNKGVKKVSESRLWIDAILNDTEPFVKPFEAYTVSRIIDGIYRSAQTGELVKL